MALQNFSSLWIAFVGLLKCLARRSNVGPADDDDHQLRHGRRVWPLSPGKRCGDDATHRPRQRRLRLPRFGPVHHARDRAVGETALREGGRASIASRHARVWPQSDDHQPVGSGGFGHLSSWRAEGVSSGETWRSTMSNPMVRSTNLNRLRPRHYAGCRHRHGMAARDENMARLPSPMRWLHSAVQSGRRHRHAQHVIGELFKMFTAHETVYEQKARPGVDE